MERIILYYSESGKTKVVAETLALNLRCDICQIKDMKKRDGLRSRLGSTIDAFRESKTEIYPPTLDLEEYGTVYIGTPGEAALEKMEIKVKARGARVVQQFSLKTRDKTAAELQKDTENLFRKLDLDLY